MKTCPNKKVLELLGIERPIIQAPMAGCDSPDLAIAVSNAGGLGSLACALLSPDQIREAWTTMRKATSKPINLNFFCHELKEESATEQEIWKRKLAPYYKEFGLDINAVKPSPTRAPFDENFCELVEELKPEIISFHFGLPVKSLVDRVKNTGAIILSSATTVDEAIWLEKNGCDAIIAQGVEAGGHRAMFLTQDLSTQVNTFTLVKQINSAVSIPIIAAGGISDAQGIKTALSLGASAVQLGTIYLFCPEARVSPLYRETLKSSEGNDTVLTNVFSGRPARGIINRFIKDIGPISAEVPEFPYASHFVAPLRKASEKLGSIDFMQIFAGQSVKAHEMSAAELTKKLS